MTDFQNHFLDSAKSKKGDKLVKYLVDEIASNFFEDIDLAISRSSLASRSVSSSSGATSSVVEKRIVQRRIRSAANAVAGTKKFQLFRKKWLSDAELVVVKGVSGSQNEKVNRPNTGFESLFSVDEDFSEDDETLIFSGLSFSQSMRLPQEDELLSLIELVATPDASGDEKLGAFQKLSTLSTVLFSRSHLFDVLLEKAPVVVQDRAMVPEFLTILGRISNLKNIQSFTKILDCLEKLTEAFLTDLEVDFVEKIKFVELVKQMFLFIPKMCYRETVEDIRDLLAVFCRFFEVEEIGGFDKNAQNGHAPKNMDFIIFYSCVDPTAIVFVELFYMRNLRYFVAEKVGIFLQKLLPIIVKNEVLFKKMGASGPGMRPENVQKNVNSFIASAVVLSMNYPDLSTKTAENMQEFVELLILIVFKNQKFHQNSVHFHQNHVKFLEKMVFQLAENQQGVYCILNVLHKIDKKVSQELVSTKNSINFIIFGQFLAQMLDSVNNLNDDEICTEIITTTISRLLSVMTKKVKAFQILLKIAEKIAALSIEKSQKSIIIDFLSNSAGFVKKLNPALPAHSKIIFTTGLSTNRQIWKKFHPRSVLESPFIDFVGHGMLLNNDDRKIGLKSVLNYLTSHHVSTDLITVDDDSFDSFLDKNRPNFDGNRKKIDFSKALVEFLVKCPDHLVDIFRSFDLQGFIITEVTHDLDRKSGQFLDKFAELLKNIDFMVDVSRRFNLHGFLVKTINKHCKNQQNTVIMDEFVLSALKIMTLLTLGCPVKEVTVVTPADLDSAEVMETIRQKFKKMNFSSRGFYVDKYTGNLAEMKPADEPILEVSKKFSRKKSENIFERLKDQGVTATVVATVSRNGPTTKTISWLNCIFDYAVFLRKAPSKNAAHRQALHLRFPFFDEDRPDWFSGIIFIMCNCQSKMATTVLSNLAAFDRESIKMLWPLSFESNFEYSNFLSRLWSQRESRDQYGVLERKVKFVDFVNFCYKSGLGIVDFEVIEQLIFAAVFESVKHVFEIVDKWV